MVTTKPAKAPAMPLDIAPIENVPLRIQVAGQLRSAILSGRLRPGTSLVETALAEQMNVSRTSIREAIQLLENDGLVESIAYKGKRVKPLTEREVAETYSLREVFEVMAVRRILENGAPLHQLRVHCDTMTEAAARGDFEGLVAADEAFHHSVIQLADHALLLASWKSLYMRIHQIMALRNRDERNLEEVAGNHPPIVDALAAGDTELAVRLIAEHTQALATFDPATIAHDP